MKTKQTVTVVKNVPLAEGIWDLSLLYDEESLAARAVRPGQFVGLYTGDSAQILPRPISVCRWLPEERTLRLVFRVAGSGTARFSRLAAGDFVEVLGFLGNGYDTAAMEGKRVLLLGGGIGIPPMLELAAQLKDKADVTAVLGYRDRNTFLLDDFRALCPTVTATEDGSAGTEGNVLDAMRANRLSADVICACGPLPMLRAVKVYAEVEENVRAWLSLEEKMACGVGACLGCVCRTTKTDGHSHVNNARVCTDGPVFDARDVSI